MREFEIVTSRTPAPDENQLLADSLLRESWICLRNEDWDEAERFLASALARRPEHAGCLAALAVCLVEGQRRFLSAEKLARKAVKLDPRDPDASYALGLTYARGGREQEARRWLRRADRLAGGDPRVALVEAELERERRSGLAARLELDRLRGVAVAAGEAAGAVAGAAAAVVVGAGAVRTSVAGRRRRRRGDGREGPRAALVLSLVLTMGVWLGMTIYGREVAAREAAVDLGLERAEAAGAVAPDGPAFSFD